MPSIDDVGKFILLVGFPIALLVFLFWFATFRLWPWVSQRTEENDKAYAARHDVYLNQIKASGEAMVAIAKAVAEDTAKADERHEQVMRKLDDIDRAVRG